MVAARRFRPLNWSLNQCRGARDWCDMLLNLPASSKDPGEVRIKTPCQPSPAKCIIFWEQPTGRGTRNRTAALALCHTAGLNIRPFLAREKMLPPAEDSQGDAERNRRIGNQNGDLWPQRGQRLAFEHHATERVI